MSTTAKWETVTVESEQANPNHRGYAAGTQVRPGSRVVKCACGKRGNNGYSGRCNDFQAARVRAIAAGVK